MCTPPDVVNNNLENELLELNDLYVRSLVYEFLLRNFSNTKIASQYEKEFGPFKNNDLHHHGSTLEEVFDIYNQNISFNIAFTSNIFCQITPNITTIKKSETATKMSVSISISNKELPSLVYDYLIRNEYFDVADKLEEITGPLEKKISGSANLDDMFAQFMTSLSPQKYNMIKHRIKKTNNNHCSEEFSDGGHDSSEDKIYDEIKSHLEIVSLNSEFEDKIQKFKPKIGSQMDKVVSFLSSKNLKTYNLSLKLNWNTIKMYPKKYPWIKMQFFSKCKGGEEELIMKNFENLISVAKVTNSKLFCKEILEKIHPRTYSGKFHTIPEHVKWKLILIGTFLSKGLTNIRHVFDVLLKVLEVANPNNYVKGKFSDEEDKIITKHVKKHGNDLETFKKLCTKLNRSTPSLVRKRYNNYLASENTKSSVKQSKNWSAEEDMLLIDSLLPNKSMRNPEYVSNIGLRYLRESKVDQKIDRALNAISAHWRGSLLPLLLQYHQGTVNTPWKYQLLKYIYENRIMSAKQLDPKNIKKSFPWINASSASACFRGLKEYNTEKPLHEVAKNSMKLYENKPALTKKQMERCEKVLQFYDPEGEM